MRKFTGPRGGANGLRNISPSRYLTFLMCQRRWAFRMIEHLAEAQGDAAARGEGFHSEQELWALKGLMPITKVGAAAVRFAPAPGYAACEVPIHVATPKSQWLGFIDLCYDIELMKEPEWRTEKVYDKVLKYQVFTPDEPTQTARQKDKLSGPLLKNGNYWGPGFRVAELATTGITVVHDWKFTGNISNTKSAADLLIDPAFTLYAAEAFMGGAKRVFGRWVYVQMKGTPTAREIWFEVTLDQILDQLEAMDENGGEMQHLYQVRAKGKDLPMPRDPSTACFAYGKQCDYYETCQPPSTILMSNATPIGVDPMTDAFRSAMTASFPGLPGKPPALPTLVDGNGQAMTRVSPLAPALPPPLPSAAPALPKAPSAPPLPPKLTATEDAAATALAEAVAPHLAQFLHAQPTVESGNINPGEAPKLPAASPEQAKVLQEIKPPAPPVQDELDGLNDEQIKELGIAIGAFDKSYKGRRPGRIGMIRAKRLAQGPRTELQQAADEDQARAYETGNQITYIPANDHGAVYVAEVSAPGLPLEVTRAIVKNTPQKSEVESADENRPGIRGLFINCSPEGNYLTLAQVLELLRPSFKAATGLDDYRLVEFGKGAGMMAVGLRDHFAAHSVDALVVDTRTQEGMAFLGAIQPIAELVVRGF